MTTVIATAVPAASYAAEYALSAADAADPMVRHLCEVVRVAPALVGSVSSVGEEVTSFLRNHLSALDAVAAAAGYDLYGPELLETEPFWGLVRSVRRWCLALEFVAMPYVVRPPRASDRSTLLEDVAAWDAEAVARSDLLYGASWRRRGGVGAYMVGIRKWDRLEELFGRSGVESVVQLIARPDTRDEAWDTLIDLRRYLLLWEGHRLALLGNPTAATPSRPAGG